jgi:hypothetical protein
MFYFFLYVNLYSLKHKIFINLFVVSNYNFSFIKIERNPAVPFVNVKTVCCH